jgi:hypothetical protein
MPKHETRRTGPPSDHNPLAPGPMSPAPMTPPGVISAYGNIFRAATGSDRRSRRAGMFLALVFGLPGFVVFVALVITLLHAL